MQIRTGLHSQLSEVSGKKHRYFKVEWSGPGTLQDQSCASWGWGQVSNSSEQSSWQRSSHAGASGLWGGCRQGASAISACETFQVLGPHRRPAHEQGGERVVPPGSSNHQGQITAFVHGPRRCPSAGVWHTAVMRVGHCTSKASIKLSVAQDGVEKTFARILQLCSCTAAKYYNRMTTCRLCYKISWFSWPFILSELPFQNSPLSPYIFSPNATEK